MKYVITMEMSKLMQENVSKEAWDKEMRQKLAYEFAREIMYSPDLVIQGCAARYPTDTKYVAELICLTPKEAAYIKDVMTGRQLYSQNRFEEILGS